MSIKSIGFVVFFLIFNGVQAETIKPWTVCYKKNFLEKSLVDGDYAFIKEGVMPFNQLIFSWNALRPQKGFFRFWVRVHEVQGGWLPWHKMFEWGEGRQRSFSDSSLRSSYCHVRLELKPPSYADGFWIKIEALEGADLSDIKLCVVSASNLSFFNVERNLSHYNSYKPVCINGVPLWSQMTLNHRSASVLCSPTSTCMLTSFICHRTYDPVAFADGVFDYGLNVFGSWQCNTAHAFETSEGRAFFYVQRLHSFGELCKFLYEGFPVVVSVRGDIEGAPKSYPSGHLMVVVGFDSDENMVICHDPAAGSPRWVYRKYKLKNFLAAWGNSRNLAYVALPN